MVEATDGVTVEAVLAIKGADPHPHRWCVDHERVRQHLLEQLRRGLDAAGHRQHTCTASDQPGRRDRAGVRCDKGEIYVRPVGGLGKPVNLFISSQHRTYTLLLRRRTRPRTRSSSATGRHGRARADQAASLPASHQSIHPLAQGDAGGDGFRQCADRRPRG